MAHPMFVKHQDLLGSAVHAIESRSYWSPYAESPKACGAGAIEAGRQAFAAYPDAQFYLDQPGVVGRGGGEVSPYGLPLNISYPKCSADALIAAGKAAMPAWIKAGPDVRAGVCAEMLERLNARSAEIAHAVMHTTGQAFPLAFQNGGPQAQDRGLEAVACAWREMKLVPYRAVWEKPQGDHPPLKLEKRFTVVPRGVALMVAGATSPTWSSYPGIFASLAAGNAVIVKPHPAAILPLAITVAAARQTLKDAGFDANLVSLLVDTAAAPVAKDAALRPDIRIIDYTGGSDFGRWLEDNARQAVVFAGKTGVHCIVVDSTDDYAGMLQNLAFTLALNSGQAGMTPRTLFVARGGVRTPQALVPPDQFGRDLAAAIGKVAADAACAMDVLGAVQTPAMRERLEAAAELGDVVRESQVLAHPQWPNAIVRTPMLVKTTAGDSAAWNGERCGLISFVVETATTAESLSLAERVMRERGATVCSVYSTNGNLLQLAEDAALRIGVALALNMTNEIFIDPPAGFADFHVAGANPAATACFIDGAFVSPRFLVAQTSRHIA